MKDSPITIQIDKRSSQEIATQIANQIKSLILTHRFTNEMIDVDHLAKDIDVDKKFVIEAFDILVKQQMFLKDKNEKYVFTYKEVADVSVVEILSVSDIIKYLKQEMKVKTFDEKTYPCDKNQANDMGFLENENIHFQKRIIYGDEYPKVYMELYFSKDKLPFIDDKAYLEKPYFEILGIDKNPSYPAIKKLKAIRFDDPICNYLNQEKNSNGFFVKETYYDDNNEVILYTNLYLNLNYFIRLKG